MNRIGRRALLQAGFSAGVWCGLHPTLACGQDDPASSRPKEGDWLVKAGDPMNAPLGPDDIAVGARPILAWAIDPMDGTVRSGSRLNQLLVIRLDTDALGAETRPRAVEGIVAYTAICTHTGCEVDDWLAEEQLLHCPCHGSKFDPRDSGRVVDGEAPRPLPALPLRLDDGRLVIAGAFTARVGFQSA